MKRKNSFRLFVVLLAFSLLFSSCASKPASAVAKDGWNTNYKYVFVHGLSGWGSYDFQNKFLKYWGMRGGDALAYLNENGYDCYSASVDPYGSAWDRACELYAQLTGSVVDYGLAHSSSCNHERFGTDYSDNPLIESWSAEDKINLIGHSFGGATIRLLAELMANGSAEEIGATPADELSPLFTGGKGDWIYSITCLASPHNGTSAYNVNDGTVDLSETLSFSERKMSDMVNSATAGSTDGRAETDYANYDLQIDNALVLNERISTLQNVYYFSVPCCSTDLQQDGTYFPNREITEKMFVKSAILMGSRTGVTEGGFEFGEEWLPNDGLVNTVSATAPSNAPSVQFDESSVEAGVWNVMPVYAGDHMSLQGGMMIKNDVHGYFAQLLNMINSI